jgi:hypothetical protein
MVRLGVSVLGLLLALAPAEAPVARPTTGVTRFEHARCKLSLTLPAGWTAVEVKPPFDATDCAFGLRPSNWLARRRREHCHTGEHAIYLSVYPGRLEQSNNLLVFEEGELQFTGRMGMLTPARITPHASGRVARGDVEVGCYGKDGEPYQGMAQVEVAVVEAHGRLFEFVATANTGSLSSKLFNQIVGGFRAGGPPRPRSPAP